MSRPRSAERGGPLSLRERAERMLADRVASRQALSTDASLHRLVHELQVHEIELVMQCEALREAHAAADDERARYTDLYDFAPTGYLTLSREGRVTEANLAAASMLGMNRETLLGGALASYVHVEDRHLLQSCLASVSAVTPRAKCDLRLADLSLGTRAVHVECVTSATGSSVRLSLLDVTAQRIAEAQLLLRDRAMRVLTHGIVITDPMQPENPIIYVNDGFESLTGYRASDAMGRNCRFLQGADTDPNTVRLLRAAVLGGLPCSVEILNYRKSGVPYWCALSITPVRDSSGRLVQFVGVQVDITERRVLERERQEAQRLEAIGRLAGGIAHDFSNVLAEIDGCTHRLRERLPIDDPLREVAGEITDASVRATLLTRQLLAFSSRQVMAMRVLDVSLLVADTATMLQRVIGEHIDLHVSSLAPGACVRADSALLEQVLVSLALHAQQAMTRGGVLTIGTERVVVDEAYRSAHNEVGDLYHASQREMRSGSYIVLSVSDSGIGMDDAMVGRVFEPSFGNTRAGPGAGMNLSLVYSVVQQCHGYIAVRSVVDRGTLFQIFLPAVAPTPSRSFPALQAEVVGAETILLVEDDAAVRALATRSLRAHGYHLLEARDGLDAIRVAAAHEGPIDLLLTDVVMPRMGGRALAETLRQQRPTTRVLFMSGYPDDEVLRRGVQQDPLSFLEKPFTQATLGAKVRAVLDATLETRGT